MDRSGFTWAGGVCEREREREGRKEMPSGGREEKKRRRGGKREVCPCVREKK
jgi:hypothetical protein